MLPNVIADDGNSVDLAWARAVEEEVSGRTPEIERSEGDTLQVSENQALMEQIRPILEEYNATMMEQFRRMQQSQRDSQAAFARKVEERLAQATAVTETAVEQGHMTQQDAEELLETLRERIESEVSSPQPEAAPMWVMDTRAQIQKIWATSGLQSGDPELAYIPTDVSHLPPFEAVQAVERAVNLAKQAKAQRIGNAPPVLVDMGTSGGSTNVSVESIIAELNREMAKPNSDDAKITALGKQLDTLINSPRR